MMSAPPSLRRLTTTSQQWVGKRRACVRDLAAISAGGGRASRSVRLRCVAGSPAAAKPAACRSKPAVVSSAIPAATSGARVPMAVGRNAHALAGRQAGRQGKLTRRRAEVEHCRGWRGGHGDDLVPDPRLVRGEPAADRNDPAAWPRAIVRHVGPHPVAAPPRCRPRRFGPCPAGSVEVAQYAPDARHPTAIHPAAAVLHPTVLPRRLPSAHDDGLLPAGPMLLLRGSHVLQDPGAVGGEGEEATVEVAAGRRHGAAAQRAGRSVTGTVPAAGNSLSINYHVSCIECTV